MKVLSDTCLVIDALHNDGFTEDFVFHGNEILWVQGKTYLQPDNVTLIDKYRFHNSKGNGLVIFAVIASGLETRGILISHCKNSSDQHALINKNNGRSSFVSRVWIANFGNQNRAIS